MTPTPDPAEITAPKDPAEYRQPRMLGASFWALIAFGVLCVLAGAGIAVLGPKLLTHRPGPAVLAPPASPEAPKPAPVATPAPAPPAEARPTPVSASSADVDRLSARIAALETHEKSTSEAAAAALAAAALVETSQGSGSFADQLAALRAISPPSVELASLTRLADTGAPSRAALAASFPDYAARAASASRAPGDGAGLGERIVFVLSKVVSLRRVGDVPGNEADARLARAERLVEDGDLDKALRALDSLPPAAREAIGPWRTGAERRAEIDRHVAALRARALQSLADASQGGA